MLSRMVHSGDVTTWLVITAFLLVGFVVIDLQRRRRITRPWIGPPRSGSDSLQKLATHLTPGASVAGMILRWYCNRARNAPLRQRDSGGGVL
jgi:hypothetical protein